MSAIVFMEASFGGATSCKLGFFACALARASLQDLHLQGRAAEKTLQLADPLLEPANLRDELCRVSGRNGGQFRWPGRPILAEILGFLYTY